MTNYLRITVKALLAESSDYTDVILNKTLDTYTVDGENIIHTLKRTFTTSGEDIILTDITDVNYFLIKNHDDTNFVTVTFGTVKEGTGTQSHVLNAGGFLGLTDLDISADITVTSDTDDVICEYILVGDA